MITKEDSVLIVCWIKPNATRYKNAFLLSFLTPGIEESIRLDWNGKFISGRQIAQQVKDKAVALYVNIVAQIASARCWKAKSLREALKTKEGNSLWWYHNVSFKDCEVDPTFNQIIQLLTIQRVVNEKGIDELVLCGADQSIINVLKNSGNYLKTRVTRKSHVCTPVLLKAFLSRFKYMIVSIWSWLVLKRFVPNSQIKSDVVFSGFWDWSVESEPINNSLSDRYFKSLPDILNKMGVTVSWFLWFSPNYETRTKKRRLKEVVLPAVKYDNLIFLQKYLSVTDLIKASLDFKPLFIYLKFRYQAAFKALFKTSKLDLFPLFSSQLIYHFCNSTLPHYVLVSIASQRAFVNLKPKFALSFLELFPHSRAFYAGARVGSPETLHGAVQHASHSREKTFVHLEPEIEFNGKPDNCAVPKPDYVFAMGELGKEIFMESGFLEEKVLLTGSTRYEYIKNDDIIRNVTNDTKNILMVASLDRDLEMDMVEAVYVATINMPQIKLFLRSHPFADMVEHPNFHVYKDRIHLTNKNLEADLKNADLILFSYSTVAEEALLRGIPVWQWLSATYNASVFRDLKGIPSFYSVSDLKKALKGFIKNPLSFIPSDRLRELVLKKCFYAADGKSSERIAAYIVGQMRNNGKYQ